MSADEHLNQTLEYAKNFSNFNDILMAISLHPDWLVRIPVGRKWAILHQVIFAGNVNQLDQLLSLQKPNKEFRLLTETVDHKTILDVARLRNDIPDMIKRLEQLIELDKLLNYARDCNWDSCYNIIAENPSYVNAKPPYRRYYFIHHLACANAIEQYEFFKTIPGCRFDLNLKADNKKVNVIAREENQLNFAQYIEKQCPRLLENDEIFTPTVRDQQQIQTINAAMEQRSLVKDLDEQLMGKSTRPLNRAVVMLQISEMRREQEEKAASVVKVEEAQQQEMLIDNLKCPLSSNIFIDPVTAADGFTYERSEITRWMETNDHSPMTNELLANKTLNPNQVITNIINMLQKQVSTN